MNKRITVFLKYNLALLFALLPATLRAQITVTDSQTVQQLMTVFAGPGVTYLNAVLTCPQNASGKWQGLSNLGFDTGIILTNGYAKTDLAASQIGVNGPQGYFAAAVRGTPGDSDLTQVSGVNTFDACKLEFDFVPAYDTLSMDYVFGSEEYQSYSCSSFNDAFAFFLSGPGISGKQNVAIIPGTTIPVSINSTTDPAVTMPFSLALCQAMGPGSPFAQYYNNNIDGDSITYFGLTKVLRASAHVVPGSIYHLKVVIADGGDATLDSGVFLKAGSLRTNVPVVPNRVEDISPLSNVFIYPNPAGDGRLHVSYRLSGEAAIMYTITDMMGRSVYKKPEELRKAGSHDDVIPLPTGLPTATYFLQIRSGTSQKMTAFTISAQE